MVKKMTGTDVKKIREQLGMSQMQFAVALRVHLTTVSYWEQDHGSPGGPAQLLMERLAAENGNKQRKPK